MDYKQPSLPPRRPTLIHRGSPKRIRLSTERSVLDEYGKVRKWTYGVKDTSNQNKIVLLVGETGAGKTTLINTMVNYILGVKFEDDTWYEITEEEAKDQTESQTSEITMYEVFSTNTPVSLTIIDTPGYGDTRGLEKDMEVAESLAILFQSNNGVGEIDAVCFVIQASNNRLSNRQQYIISSVLSLFGKDIANNIVFLITHSDGMEPKNVLGLINKARIPCRRNESGQPFYFLFNNRQADVRNNDYLAVQETAWKNSMNSMKNFLQSLDIANRKSLELTSHVLIERVRLEAFICNLQLQIQEMEQKKTEKVEIQKVMIQNKENIDACKNFTFTVKKTVKLKLPIRSASWKNRKATTCTVCEENCHDIGCWWASNPSQCEVMKHGFCTVCTGKCHHSQHVKEKYKYIIKNSSERVEFDNYMKKFYKAEKNLKTFAFINDKLDQELQRIEDHISILLFNAYRTIKQLSQIALKPDSAFTLKHLNFFIPRVKEAGKEDWVRELEGLRRNAHAEESNKDALSYLQAGLASLEVSNEQEQTGQLGNQSQSKNCLQ